MKVTKHREPLQGSNRIGATYSWVDVGILVTICALATAIAYTTGEQVVLLLPAIAGAFGMVKRSRRPKES